MLRSRPALIAVAMLFVAACTAHHLDARPATTRVAHLVMPLTVWGPEGSTYRTPGFFVRVESASHHRQVWVEPGQDRLVLEVPAEQATVRFLDAREQPLSSLRLQRCDAAGRLVANVQARLRDPQPRQLNPRVGEALPVLLRFADNPRVTPPARPRACGS